MLYPYLCKDCSEEFDVAKSLSMIDDPEKCPECGSPETMRTIARSEFFGASDWDKAEFNPGLGCVVRNNLHKKKILKDLEARGKKMEEVGNESVESMHKYYENVQSDRRRRSWAEADRIKMNEARY